MYCIRDLLGLPEDIKTLGFAPRVLTTASLETRNG